MASDIKKLAGRRVRHEEDAPSKKIEVTTVEKKVVSAEEDPFVMTYDMFKSLTGLQHNFFRKQINKKDTVKSKANEIGSFAAYDNFMVVTPNHNPVMWARVYEMSGPHYAAVQAKVANITDLGYDLVPSYKAKRRVEDATSERARENAERRLEDEKQEILDWFDSLNQVQPFSETLHNLWVDFESTGNAYIEVGRTKSGKIEYLGHIPSSTMRVRRDRDGFVQLMGNKVVYFRNFGADNANPLTDDPNPNEVLHIKNYTPLDSYYGVPDIVAAQEAIAGDDYAARFNLDYFEHKAVPRYIITLKGAELSDASQRKIVEMFETGVKGKNHRSIFVPLPADSDKGKVEFKMEAVENGRQDSSFNTFRKANMDEIFMVHRTPKTKAGYMDGVGLAAARDADKGFKEQVTRPKQTMIEKRINVILNTVTDNFKFELNELTLSDEETQSKIDERYLRMQTIVPNEVRKRMGLPPMKGGDEPVQLNAQAAADQRAQGNQSRTRDQQRSSGATDSAGNGRNAQGDGRSAP